MSENPVLVKARQAGRVLKAFLSDHAARLRYGARVRATIHKTIQAGQTPSGYRVEWHQQSVRRVLLELKQCASEFDANHPWDATSNDDLKDILRAAFVTVE